MYTYDIDAAAMFEDRTHQFEKFGIPLDEIERVGLVRDRRCRSGSRRPGQPRV
jgi:hypothetical protein